MQAWRLLSWRVGSLEIGTSAENGVRICSLLITTYELQIYDNGVISKLVSLWNKSLKSRLHRISHNCILKAMDLKLRPSFLFISLPVQICSMNATASRYP